MSGKRTTSNRPESERVSAGSLGKALVEVGALRFGKLTLPSGMKSLYDIDLRLVPSFPDIYTTVLAAYVELADRVGDGSFDSVAGVATAGVTISAPLAVMLKKPMMYVRRQGEVRGEGRIVEGTSRNGASVLLIDDLVSTGSSLVYATGALRKEGYVVKDTAVLVDRMEGGGARLARIGVRLNSFATTRDILAALLDSGLLKKSQVAPILRRIQRPGAKRS